MRPASDSTYQHAITAAAVTIVAVVALIVVVLSQPATFHGRLEISPILISAQMPASLTSSGGNVTLQVDSPSYLDVEGTIPSYWMIAAKGG